MHVIVSGPFMLELAAKAYYSVQLMLICEVVN